MKYEIKCAFYFGFKGHINENEGEQVQEEILIDVNEINFKKKRILF